MSSFNVEEEIDLSVEQDIDIESHELRWGNGNELDLNSLTVLH